jgi:hypothetical protein
MAPVSTEVQTGTFVHASAASDHDMIAALANSGASEGFEVRRFRDGNWEVLAFEGPLEPARQHFPILVATLGDGRAALQIWQAETLSDAAQHRSYVYDGAGWSPLDAWRDATLRESLHQGPDGALWRVQYEGSDAIGTATISEWTGAAWQRVHGPLRTPSRWSFLRHIATSVQGTLVIFDTHTQLGAFYAAHLLVDGSSRELSTDWGAGDVEDVDHDPLGNPILTLVDRQTPATTVRLVGHAGGGWRELARHDPVPRMVSRAISAIVGEQLVVGWTETQQRIDTGFGMYTDCDLRMFQVNLDPQ